MDFRCDQASGSLQSEGEARRHEHERLCAQGAEEEIPCEYAHQTSGGSCPDALQAEEEAQMKIGRAERLKESTGRVIAKLKPVNYNWNFKFLRGKL
jgi:hypothetical protein